MTRLETNGYYALGLPLYAAIVAAELLVAKRHRRSVYRLTDTMSNLAAGIGEVVLGLFLGPLLLALYDFGFDRLAIVRWGSDLKGEAAKWTLAFLLGDLCYYVYHRAGHTLAVLWAIHGVHHQAREMNVSVALRHPWLSDLYSAPFYAVIPLLGVPPTHFFVAISFISFYALTVHSHFFHRPSLFVFVTPASHIVHHAKNAPYVGKNFGAMFTIWDRMFGTHVDLDPSIAPDLGTSDGYRTHSGALAQWLGFRDIVARLRHAAGARDVLRVLMGPPGARPAKMDRETHPSARQDDAIPAVTKRYALVQMIVTTALAAWVLWFRDDHSNVVGACGASFIVLSLIAIGGLLDGRAYAVKLEVIRWGVAGLMVTAIYLRP